MPRPVKDLTNRRFGRLTAIRSVGRKFGGNTYWLCRCDCGAEVEVKNSHLTAPEGSNTASCGCYIKERCAALGKSRAGWNRTHGGSGTREFSSYNAMLRRCYDRTHRNYKDYGGRGIQVCRRWLESFGAFLADMGHRPEGTTLDRKDNQGDYEPGNCRWATNREQATNSRRNVRLTHDGLTLTLVEWAEKIGIRPKTLWSRLYTCGWPLDKALTAPVAGRFGRG